MISLQYEVKEGKDSLSTQTRSLSSIDEIKEMLSYMKLNLARIAREALKEEQANGFDKSPVTLVDNSRYKKEDEVKPFGKIEYYSRVETADFLVPLYQRLIDVSRVDTGLYKDSHAVLLNTSLIATNVEMFRTFLKTFKPKETDVIRFVNLTPYASKLERHGTTSGRSQRRLGKATDKRQRSGIMVRQPNGAYYLTARSIIRQFKGNAKIRFEWINGSRIASIPKPTISRRGKPLRYTFAKRKGYYTHPSIAVRFYDGGTL